MKTLEEYARELTHLTGQYIARQAGEAFYAGKQHGAMEKAAEHAAQRDGKDALISHLTARVATLEAVLKKALLLDPTCEHGTLRRGGAIWTFCEDCGKQWSDDEGGYKPQSSNTIIAEIEAVLSTSPAVSLNRIRAAAVREAAEEIKAGPQVRAKCKTVKLLIEMAERLEAGEGDNA